jgi:hypothetical protein
VSPAGSVDDQLEDVILAIRELLRSRDRVTVPSCGIDLVFDAGTRDANQRLRAARRKAT